MIRPRLTHAALLSLAAAGPVAAHPHVFADAGYRLIFDDQGRLAQIRTDWRYDELFSLLMVEEKAADADGDGAVSTPELALLQDFDSDWPEDYDGDLHISQNDQPVLAGPPGDWSVDWEDGQLISTHSRSFDPPLDLAAGPVVISPYDPGYYVAYAVAPEPVIEGRDDCRVTLAKPDIDAEAQRVADEIANTPADVDLASLGYLEVGARFAEVVTLTCGE